jgi:hypothetical protein
MPRSHAVEQSAAAALVSSGGVRGGVLSAPVSPRTAPAGSGAVTHVPALSLDPKNPNQLAVAPGVRVSVFSNLEHGTRSSTHAIVLHMTGGSAAGTLNGYRSARFGAHFLVGKDGSIVQTAGLNQKTLHVGLVRPKGYQPTASRNQRIDSDLTPASRAVLDKMNAKQIGFKPGLEELARLERAKPYGSDRHDETTRLPINADSLGIEFEAHVGADGDYEALTDAQKVAGLALVEWLQGQYALSDADVYEHPDVSYKQYTEARGAWQALRTHAIRDHAP